MSGERIKSLHHIVERVQLELAAWEADIEEIDLLPEDSLSGAIETALHEFSLADVPREIHDYLPHVQRLAKEWSSYRNSVARKATTMPSYKLFDAIGKLCAHRLHCLTPPRAPLEPVPDLFGKQGLSHEQIAKIYEWKTPDGHPDTLRVQQELADPGRHTTDYVDPRMERDKRALAIARNGLSKLIAGCKQKIAAMSPDDHGGTPGPESFEDLVAIGCDADQIAKIKLIKPEEAAEEILAVKEERPLETRVARWRERGLAPVQIANLLSIDVKEVHAAGAAEAKS